MDSTYGCQKKSMLAPVIIGSLDSDTLNSSRFASYTAHVS